MIFWRVFERLRGRKIAHCQFTTFHQWNPSLIVSFVRCRSTSRFPLSRTPLLLRQNNALEDFQNQHQLTLTILSLRKIHDEVQKFSLAEVGSVLYWARAGELSINSTEPLTFSFSDWNMTSQRKTRYLLIIEKIWGCLPFTWRNTYGLCKW